MSDKTVMCASCGAKYDGTTTRHECAAPDPDLRAAVAALPTWRYGGSFGIDRAAVLALLDATPAGLDVERYTFRQWDGTLLEVLVSGDDPGDMGEPRMVIDYDAEPNVTFICVAARLAKESKR